MLSLQPSLSNFLYVYYTLQNRVPVRRRPSRVAITMAGKRKGKKKESAAARGSVAGHGTS